MKDKQFEQKTREADQWSLPKEAFIDSSWKVSTSSSFYNPFKYVGTYELGKDSGTYFSLLKKPNWFHRTMVRLILGWVWKDN